VYLILAKPPTIDNSIKEFPTSCILHHNCEMCWSKNHLGRFFSKSAFEFVLVYLAQSLSINYSVIEHSVITRETKSQADKQNGKTLSLSNQPVPPKQLKHNRPAPQYCLTNPKRQTRTRCVQLQRAINGC
jgi:hypothetical protein